MRQTSLLRIGRRNTEDQVENIMKSRQWLAALGLLLLVMAALVGSFLTRDAAAPAPLGNPRGAAGKTPLIDERPLLTARSMAKLASGADEQKVADGAADAADNEVDLAFHDGLRAAADHPPQAKAALRPLYDRAAQSEAQVKADQDSIVQLKKQLAAASVTHQDSLQEQLDVAQAQLELDQDDLSDAKEDLMSSGADPGSMIQRQFDEHQAAEHGTEGTPAQSAAHNAEPNYDVGSLFGKFTAWRALSTKAAQLVEAHDEALQAASTLGRTRDELQKQIDAEKASIHASQPTSGAKTATGAAGATVKTLHVISDDQKNLVDLSRRIQDEQDLQNTYLSWIGLVHAHQRTVLHGVIQSALWILLIILLVYLADRTIDHYLVETGEGRTRLHTLRAVIRFAVQAVGVLLMLLVVFGAPQQLPTIIGFAGAGLTVALKDFIVAFFGWFVLMGKNGMRVGDWVEINGVAGEVLEINLLRTVLLETGNWTDTGHPTGRKVAFVNSYAIEGHFFNFTTSGQWLWDELRIPLPAGPDPYLLIDKIQNAVAKETEANARAAEKEWEGLTGRYRVRSVSAVPAVNLRPAATGVELYVRYITRANERFAMRTRLNHALVQLLRGSAEKEVSSAAK
jgi:small-conductance mechanosensitive channel